MHIWSELAWEEVRVDLMAEVRTRCTLNRCATLGVPRRGAVLATGLDSKSGLTPQVRIGQAVCAEDAYMYLYSTHAAVYQRRGFSFLRSATTGCDSTVLVVTST